MILHSYVMSNPDEVDVLPDALESLSRVSDRIFVVDGGLGGGTLCHHPRFTQPLGKWLANQKGALARYDLAERLDWIHRPGWQPITFRENRFLSPADQRNWVGRMMAKFSPQPDWILWIDSDEILSNELVARIRDELPHVPSNVTNICPTWLTLVEDELHCVEHMSGPLAHARLHRPGSVVWEGNWHEHGNFEGERMWWSERVIHTRALYRRRLWTQRGHSGICGGTTPLWKNAKMIAVPDGVTWPPLDWPKEEKEIPFDADASRVWHRTGPEWE